MRKMICVVTISQNLFLKGDINMYEELLVAMREIKDNNEWFILSAEITKKTVDALVDIGFTREEAITLTVKGK
jgi:hypothetical protein